MKTLVSNQMISQGMGRRKPRARSWDFLCRFQSDDFPRYGKENTTFEWKFSDDKFPIR